MIKQFLVRTKDGKELHLWYHSMEECESLYPECSISEINDTSYIEFIEKIISKSERIPNSENYKIRTNNIDILFRFLKDEEQYLPMVKYMVWDRSKLTYPILKQFEYVDKFYKTYFEKNNDVEYSVISFRKYGQPKLSKPKELCNIKEFSSVLFSKASCPLFKKGNDLYIKHRDYFSEIWKPPIEDFGQSQDYYLNKYFNKNRRKKFIYSDNWGSIILRNEAWIRFTNIFSLKNVTDKKGMYKILKDIFCEYYKVSISDFENSEWKFFLERVTKEIYECG